MKKLSKKTIRRASVIVLSAALATGLAVAAFATTETTSGGSAAAQGSTPPAIPQGMQGGTPPAMPSGGMGGANTMTYDYSGTLAGALTVDGEAKTSDGETYTADTADENAVLTENAGTLSMTSATLNKSGDDTNGDNCNFYGLNSIVLSVGSGSADYISDSSLNATSEGSNGIFATDNGTVYANNDSITTSAGNSRGLDATYGGTIVANNMTITTAGDPLRIIATDRGGGDISVTNSSLSTAGSGSPLLYSTGDIEVNNVTGTSTGSQIAGMEGLNTILIHNSVLESKNTSKTASDPMADGIIIYQSTSGDAESKTGARATFQAVDSTLKSAITEGTMFYFTNTSANAVLKNTTLDFDSSKANLITVQGNDSNNWGTAGSNGATVNFTGIGETMTGNIDVDTISTLNLYLLNGTTYTGAVSISANSVNTSAAEAPVTVNVDADSKWVVTGNSTVTNLNAADGSQIVDADGKTVTIIVNGATQVSGDSAYTVTVSGTCTNTVTTGTDNAVSTDLIDRTGFDSYYGVSTAF